MSERTGLILSGAAGLDARLDFGDQVRLAAVAGEVCEGAAAVRGEGAEETLELESRVISTTWNLRELDMFLLRMSGYWEAEQKPQWPEERVR